MRARWTSANGAVYQRLRCCKCPSCSGVSWMGYLGKGPGIRTVLLIRHKSVGLSYVRTLLMSNPLRIYCARYLDNLNNKFWFRLAAVDPQTAEQVTEALTLVRLPERGVGLGFGGVGGLTGNATLRTPGQRVSLFRGEWMKGLPRGICLARGGGELWLIRVPLL